MPKRIGFIAPVEYMSGDLSGKQDLDYQGNDKAWNTTGTNIAADNYRPSYIGARKSSTGKTYFAVRTKSTFAGTSANREAMALFGGGGAVATRIRMDAEHLEQITLMWKRYVLYTGLKDLTLRGFLFKQARLQLEVKQNTIQIQDVTGSLSPVVYKNPWVPGGSGTDLNVPEDIVTKFQQYLGA